MYRQLSLNTSELEKLQDLRLDGRRMVVVSIDIEAYDDRSDLVNHGKVKELGVSWVASYEYPDLPTMHTAHLVVEGRQAWRNVHCADNVEGFHCGESSSEVLPLQEIQQWLAALFEGFVTEGLEIWVVGWAMDNDIKWLTDPKQFHSQVLDRVHETCDLSRVWRALHHSIEACKLGDALLELGVILEQAHNAGNDAHYTLVYLLALVDCIAHG